MADLTDGQLAQCIEASRIIIREVLTEHIKTCPHHLAFMISRAKIIGVVIGMILASGISSGTAAALIMKVFVK